MAFLINKRTSDSQLRLAPAAQGVGLVGILVDPNGDAVGHGFPIKFSVASGGAVYNEESIMVRADRGATVSALSITKDGMPLAVIDLAASVTITPADTLTFSPGTMSITLGGMPDTAITALFTDQYVINEEPTLE